jgi:hypothetical protein
MAFVAAAEEIYLVQIDQRLEEQQALNILMFRTHLGDNDVETHLLKKILDCVMASLVPIMPKTYELVGVHGVRCSPTTGPPLSVFPVAGDIVAGDAAREALPSFCSTLVSIQSERGGRSGRGRMFIPGVPEVATEGSKIIPESPYWAGILAYVACIAAAFIHSGEFPVANQWEIGVMSRKIGGPKPPFLSTGFSPALRLTPRDLIATTRSRKVGHGS